jgi:hypothetical protein
MAAGTIAQKPIEAITGALENIAESDGRGIARHSGGEVARTAVQKAAERLRRHEPAIQQRGDSGAQPPFAQLREHQGHVIIFLGHRAADPQRLVERLGDKARHVRVGGEVEAGIDVRLEREFPQQRQAERVDGGNRDVAVALLQVAPARGIELREAAGFFQANAASPASALAVRCRK